MNKASSLVWARAATLAAVAVASVLSLIKLLAWVETGSVALLGSLADSALDLFASLVAVSAVRYAAQPPDDNHRFGHYKAEAMTALGQVALIGASGALVFWESIQRMVNPKPIEQSGLAMAVLIVALALTCLLTLFQTIAIKRSGSLIVHADRMHYLGDVIATGGALAAVALGHYFGWARADAIAGLVAAVFLVRAGWSIAQEAIPQLMDQELPRSERDMIENLLANDPDICGYHALRTRRAGMRRFIQVDIQIDPTISFREAHCITDRLELALEDVFPDADVIIHPDPAGEARLESRAQETAQAGQKKA